MDWMELLQRLAYAVLIAVIPVLTTYVINLMKTKSDSIKAETDELIIADTLDDVLDLIMSVTAETSQTYVDALKKAGTFNKEAHLVAFNTTKDKVMSLLSVEAKELLMTLYKDVDAWMDTQIEAAVWRNKNKKAGE